MGGGLGGVFREPARYAFGDEHVLLDYGDVSYVYGENSERVIELWTSSGAEKLDCFRFDVAGRYLDTISKPWPPETP